MSTKFSKGRRLGFEAMEDRRLMAVAPVIISNGGGATAFISVPEDTRGAITNVTATDADGDLPRYSIVGGEDAARFNISILTGRLQFKQNPNFERPLDVGRNNVYVVKVAATDATGLQDTQTIRVRVQDVNERPVFTNNGGGNAVTINMPENTRNVTVVSAVDPENPTTLGIRYSIVSGDDANLFSVGALTGTLVFRSPPDFESPTHGNTYEVKVQAIDSTGVTNIQTITVNVTDVVGA